MAKRKKDPEFDKYFNEIKSKKKKRSRKRAGFGSFLIIFFILLMLLAAFGIYIYSGLPSLEQLENPKPQLASKVFTADGELLGQYFIQNRIETNIDSLPKSLIAALISTEDRRFYKHWGVDVSRVGKAIVKNLLTFSREGASTLTQQLAKNLYDLKRVHENLFQTGIRKIREWITAVQIERNFTKNEILELYLNVSYFGRGAYGIESAAKIYFDKKGIELTLPESALFIALLKSPEHYDPIKYPENAIRRRNLVMYNMVQNHMLTEEEYDKLKTTPIELASSSDLGRIKSDAPYFMEYVRRQMNDLSKKYGFDLYRDGVNIYTTLDLRMQKIANSATAEHIKKYQELFDKNWSWSKNQDLLSEMINESIRNSSEYKKAENAKERAQVFNRLKFDKDFINYVKKEKTKVQVGFIVIDPKTGQIKAMVGGEDQNFGRGLNHTVDINRQAGSSFKPFVYTVAIDNGYFPAYTLLNQKFDYNGWSPSNSNDEYSGYMTLREALAHSVNVVAGRLTISEIAPPAQVVKYAKKMGIESHLDPYPSIALGTSEVTPLEMASAFGTLANKGVHVSPIAITKIEDKNGILIDRFVPQYTEAISQQTASIITNMLEEVISSGTGIGVRNYFHLPAAGKTGTTQDFSDAWFVGYTPALSAAVWVGFDDHRVKFTNWYGQGAQAALPIWAIFMEKAYKKLNLPLEYFELAPGVIQAKFCKVDMDAGDARLAIPNCPEIYTDIINEKNLPPKCEIHSDKIIREKKDGSGW